MTEYQGTHYLFIYSFFSELQALKLVNWLRRWIQFFTKEVINQWEREREERHTKSFGIEKLTETKVVTVAQKENSIPFASSIILRHVRVDVKFPKNCSEAESNVKNAGALLSLN